MSIFKSKNPIEVSLDNLSEIALKIMNKCINNGELTESDKLFLIMYQKEKTRATTVPLFRKIMNGTKEIINMLKDFKPKENIEVSNQNDPINIEDDFIDIDNMEV